MEPAGIPQLTNLIQRLIGLSVPLAFIVATIYLIWGGIKLIISGGDQKNVQAAKNMIQWAILGIFILGLAFTILKMIESFTGVEVTKFCLGFKPLCP